jgi:hypothetical protein
MDSRATFDAIETSIFESRLDDFKPQEVANLAWAFSKAGLDGDFNDESPGACKRHVHTTGCIVIDFFSFSSSSSSSSTLSLSLSLSHTQKKLKILNPVPICIACRCNMGVRGGGHVKPRDGSV